MSSADHNRDRKMRTIRLIGIGAAALTAAVFLFSRLVFSARETSGAAQPDSMWTAIGPEDSAGTKDGAETAAAEEAGDTEDASAGTQSGSGPASDGTKAFDAEGKTVVRISTLEEYLDVARMCHYDTWSSDKYILLDADLDLGALYQNAGPGEESAREGICAAILPSFGGVFDGQGHEITGFLLEDGMSETGLFGSVRESGVVRGLRVSGEVIPSGLQKRMGGIAGSNSGTIENCAWNGTVSSHTEAGGIAGRNLSTGRIVNCTSAGSVDADTYAGGITGYNEGIVRSCVNRSSVNTVYADVPYTTDMLTNTVENILMTGKLSVSENTSVRSCTGGIAGSSDGLISDCTNEGNVGYEHTGYYTGGIAGSSTGLTRNCRNIGTVLGRKDTAGIVGQQEPYMELEMLESTLNELDEELNSLDAMVEDLLSDTSQLSNDTTLRLNRISNYAGVAKENVKILSDDAEMRADQAVEKANRITSSMQQALRKMANALSRGGDYVGQLKNVAGSFGSDISDIIGSLNLTDEERQRAEEALRILQEDGENASEEIRRIIGNGSEDIPLPKDVDPVIADILTKDEAELLQALLEKAGITADELKDMTAEEMLERIESAVDPEEAVDPETYASLKEKILSDADRIEQYKEEIARQAERVARDVDDLTQAGQTLYAILDAHEDELSRIGSGSAIPSLQELESVLKNSPDITGGLSGALDDIAGVDLHLNGVDEAARTAGNGLYDSLGNLMNEMNSLNSSVNSGAQDAVGDLRGISEQIRKIIDTVENGVRTLNDRGTGVEEHIEDTSSEDTEDATRGRTTGCVNEGKVDADSNVGGIVGLIGMSLDTDPEQDVVRLGAGNAIDYVFRTKGIVDQCENRGDIFSRNGYAGGIAGRMEMGLVKGCENYGTVETDGDFCGGISGYSAAQILSSGARCRISGGSYIGGIAGFGNRISACRSMVTVGETSGYTGAIAGEVKELDPELVFDNYYYATELFGINGVSYEGIAQEISHEQMQQDFQGTEEMFSDVHISFSVEGQIVDVLSCPYGGDLAPDRIPKIPGKEGFHSFWSRQDFTGLKEDEIVEAVYERIVTLLSSKAKRPDAKPVFLAEGEFYGSDELIVMQEVVPEAIGQEPAEQWDVEIPDDGADTHRLRFLKDPAMTDVVLCRLQDGQWQPLEVEAMGEYLTFSVQGDQVTIGVMEGKNGSALHRVKELLP